MSEKIGPAQLERLIATEVREIVEDVFTEATNYPDGVRPLLHREVRQILGAAPLRNFPPPPVTNPNPEQT